MAMMGHTPDEVDWLGEQTLRASKELVHGEPQCDPGGRRYHCGYHEGWRDAIDAIVTAMREMNAQEAED